MTDNYQPLILQAGPSAIKQAAERLRAGELVALPTETVYGLAARADREAAVQKIYRAKGRPDFNPLIVHVLSLDAVEQFAKVDERARALAAAFWPGPLTMVLPLRLGAPIAPAVTAGLPTVALRCPAHPLMKAVLRTVELPLAAPSANRSGAVSPTSAKHVVSSLGSRAGLVLDGGETERGLESTIVALRHTGWSLLRPGPVSEAQIEEVIGESKEDEPNVGRIEAPGQLVSHYSPGKPVRLNAKDAMSGEFLIGFGRIKGDITLSARGDIAEAAVRLYACLHQATEAPQPAIAVAQVPEDGIGVAINDRLRRAAV